MAFQSLALTLAGQADASAVAIEAQGQRYDLGADRRFSITLTVPEDASSFALTVVDDQGQRLVRRCQLRRFSGGFGGAA